jgi:hypothetical protein
MKRALSTALRGIVPVGAAIVGFLLVVWCVDAVLPPREMPSTIREKLGYLAAHKDEYDVLFLGSSRIQNHAMPGIFDRLAAAGGRPVKSFNAGVASMHAPEDTWFLEQILTLKPKRLRWVFVEADYFPTELQADQQGTLRGVAWHDWPRFRQLAERVLIMKKGIGWRDKVGDTFGRFRDFLQHLAAFGARATNLGRGIQLFERWQQGVPWGENPEPLNPEKLGPHQDGWLAAKPEDDDDHKRLAQVLETRRASPPKPQQADRISQAALGDLIDRVTAAGAVPILVIPPRARSNYFIPSPANARRAAAVIDLCDPGDHPELYAPENRIDSSHLNEHGAEIFTRLLAERFLQLAPPKTAEPAR